MKRFRKSFVLSANCWQTMVKGLFAQFIVVAFVLAFAFLLFGPLVDSIAEELKQLDIGGFVEETVVSIADGSFDSREFTAKLEEKLDQIRSAVEAIPNVFNRVEVSYVIMILLMCFYRILISCTDVTVSGQLNEFMTTGAKRPFLWYFFKEAGVSLKFVLLQFVIAFPLDLIVLFASVGFYMLFLVTFRWWTIVPAILIALIMYSVRQSLFAFWLPSITAEKLPVAKAFANGIGQLVHDFWRVFIKTFVLILFMEAVSIIAGYFIPVKEIGVAVTAAVNLVGFFFIKCINMVEYYETTGKPYFYKRPPVSGTEWTKKKNKNKQSD